MKAVEVKYQYMHKSRTEWGCIGSTTIYVDDTNNTTIKNQLLAHNPSWKNVRILDKKVK